MIAERTNRFLKTFSKITDSSTKERLVSHIRKIIQNPEIGKPMRYARKGTREVHIPPFRLSYAYFKEENRIVFLELYHKDEQ
ncbi:type II toxin-antitoxin system RelE/ParE family toxin [Candidatus Woesearchaeota archaeon]|nr:MAG: type II toxin-antitoxin system RelE/ParE family toxin [Candidatus Woesearchaeota archaeon]